MSINKTSSLFINLNITRQSYKQLNTHKPLPLDDKEYAVEVIEKQLIEAKRAAIAKRAKEAMVNLRKGNTKIGDIKELYKDLESD